MARQRRSLRVHCILCSVVLLVASQVRQAQARCSSCQDVSPDGSFTCSQQRMFGKCGEAWMQHYCDFTCGRCSCGESGTLAAGVPASAPMAPDSSKQAGSQTNNASAAGMAPASPSTLVPAPPTIPTPPAPAAASLLPYPQETWPCNDHQSVKSFFQQSNNTSIMQSALSSAGLMTQLEDGSLAVTIFIPTDSAWAQLAKDSRLSLDKITADSATLGHLALYHVLDTVVPPDQLSKKPFLQPYWDGSLLFGTHKGYISGEGTTARITRSIHLCSSYVYLMEYVLLPAPDISHLPPFKMYTPSPAPAPAAPVACQPTDTPWFTIMNNANLTESARVIKLAGLDRMLNQADKDFTVLVPDNIAWQKVRDASISTDPQHARSVLLQHILPVFLPANKIPRGALYRSMNENAHPLFLGHSSGGTIRVQTQTGGDAQLVATDLGRTCRAAVHVISAVLGDAPDAQKPSDAEAAAMAAPAPAPAPAPAAAAAAGVEPAPTAGGATAAPAAGRTAVAPAAGVAVVAFAPAPAAVPPALAAASPAEATNTTAAVPADTMSILIVPASPNTTAPAVTASEGSP